MNKDEKLREIGFDGKSPIMYDYDCAEVVSPCVKFKGGIRARHIPSGGMGWVTGEKYVRVLVGTKLSSCRFLFDDTLHNVLCTSSRPGYLKTVSSQEFRSDVIRWGGFWFARDCIEIKD